MRSVPERMHAHIYGWDVVRGLVCRCDDDADDDDALLLYLVCVYVYLGPCYQQACVYRLPFCLYM